MHCRYFIDLVDQGNRELSRVTCVGNPGTSTVDLGHHPFMHLHQSPMFPHTRLRPEPFHSEVGVRLSKVTNLFAILTYHISLLLLEPGHAYPVSQLDPTNYSVCCDVKPSPYLFYFYMGMEPFPIPTYLVQGNETVYKSNPLYSTLGRIQCF